MNGYLVQFPTVTVWVQGARSHAAARRDARWHIAQIDGPIYPPYPTGSMRVVHGKPGPRRPA